MELRKKLRYWMVGVVVISILIVGITTNFWTRFLFAGYVDQHFRYRSQQLQEVFSSYYQYHQSWQGVGELLIFPQGRPMMMGRWGGVHGGPGQGANLVGILAPGERLRLTDIVGTVLVDSLGDPQKWNQNGVSLAMLKSAAPILDDNNRVVGYLLLETAQPTDVHSLEKKFIDSVLITTLVATMIIGGGAAIAAGRVAHKLVSPLDTLTRAARRFTQEGSLQPVQPKGGSSLELEQLTRAFNQMVEQINRNEKLRRQLMGDVAHELRTPLTILRCNLEALAAGVNEPSDENLAQLEEEVVRLVGLVEELQELSLLEQKQLSLSLAEENLTLLARRAVDFFQVEARQRGVKLFLTAPPVNPAIVDGNRIIQVLVNLLVNAFRYVPDGGTINVVIQAAPDPRYWQVLVEDNGPGILEEDLPYIFERFYKGDKARSRDKPGYGRESIHRSVKVGLGNRKQEGSGLGLAIVKALVQAHGGKIAVANRPQGGAVVSFVIPRG